MYKMVAISFVILIIFLKMYSFEKEKMSYYEKKLNYIKIPFSKKPNSIKYKVYTSLYEYYLHQNIAFKLVTINQSNEIESGLATHWKVEDNGKRYTFYIGEHYWSNGEKISVEAIAKNILLNNKHDKRNILSDLILIKSGKKQVYIKENEIVVVLRNPTDKFLYYLALPENGLVDWENIDINENVSPKHKFSGAYEVFKVESQKLILKNNQYFRGQKIKNSPQKVVFNYYKENDHLLSAVQEEKVDFLEARADDVLLLYSKKKYDQLYGSYDILKTIQIRKVSDDQKKILKLFNHGFDRSILCNDSMRKPARKLKWLSEIPEYQGVEKKHTKINYEKRDLKKVSIPIYLSKDEAEEVKKDINIIKKEALKFGITFEIYNVDTPYEKLRSDENYSVMLREMGTFSPDDANLLNSYFCSGYKPFSVFENLICNDVKKALDFDLKKQQRIKSLIGAYDKIFNSGYLIPLYFKPRVFLINNRWDHDKINLSNPYPNFNLLSQKP